jgi:hypothetical protein
MVEGFSVKKLSGAMLVLAFASLQLAAQIQGQWTKAGSMQPAREAQCPSADSWWNGPRDGLAWCGDSGALWYGPE